MTKTSFMKRGLATLGVAGLLVAGSSSLASAAVGPARGVIKRKISGGTRSDQERESGTPSPACC